MLQIRLIPRLTFTQSVRDHRLPIFSGVVLSVSGIEDVSRRTEINRRVTEEGGSYVKNIERPVRVSDLKSNLQVGVDLESCATLLTDGCDLRTAVEDPFRDLVIHDTP